MRTRVSLICAGAAFILLSFGAIWVLLLAPSSEKGSMERKTSDALTAWKSKLVTVELKNVDFDEALKRFQHLTGVRCRGDGIQKKVTLSLRDAPFWNAVAKLSAATQTGFELRADLRFGAFGKDTELVFMPSLPLCNRQEVVGPFRIALWYAGTKSEPLLLIQASSVITEGNAEDSRGIRKLALIGSDGKRVELKPSVPEEGLRPDKAHWQVPPDLALKPATIRGEMECAVFSNPQEFTIPVGEAGLSDFKQHGGGKVSVTFTKEGAKTRLKYVIEWNIGLGLEDAKKLSKIDKLRVEDLKREEEEAYWDWIISKSRQLRLLHLQEFDLVDRDGKVIPLLGGKLSTPLAPELRGEVSFATDHQPKEVRIRLCERKLAIAVFEFKDALPGNWK